MLCQLFLRAALVVRRGAGISFARQASMVEVGKGLQQSTRGTVCCQQTVPHFF